MNDIQSEINTLEAQLLQAKARLKAAQLNSNQLFPCNNNNDNDNYETTTTALNPIPSIPPSLGPPTHFLLLLSDSALPLGSFAFSSGLESYLAHNPHASTFTSFLPSSLSSFASTTLPYVLAARRQPERLPHLDDQLDAAVMCTVGRRASVAQGRALVGIWERSFRGCLPVGTPEERILRDFTQMLKKSSSSSNNNITTNNSKNMNSNNNNNNHIVKEEVPLVSAHLAPLFGALCALVGLTLRQTAYVFMLSHVKALVSAAVRASVFGPYQAQKILAGGTVQWMIDVLIDREWNTCVEEAGQSVPVMDLWIGRHELLYSRIFNS